MRTSRLLAAGAAAVATAIGSADILNIPTPLPFPGGSFGQSVHGIPDINGDGYDDFIVGEPDADAGAIQSAGRAHVFSGKTGLLIRTHTTPSPTTNGQFGFTVVGFADVNGDGAGDYAIAAPRENSVAGRVYVYSGATGTLLYTISPGGSVGYFGTSMGVVPDCTGDGRPDLVIGRGGPFFQDGPARVYNGATGALWLTLENPSGQLDTMFSRAVAGIPDVNGDGRGDIVVGAHLANDGFTDDAGLAFVFSGANGALLHTLKSPAPRTDGWFGWSAAGAPDFTGDGRGDIIIGALQESVTPGGLKVGRVHVYSGATGAFVRTYDSPNPAELGNFGWSVFGSADINGDGRGEVVIGARDEPAGAGKTGRAYVYSGAGTALLQSRVAPVNGQRFGASAVTVDDVNADGVPDLLVGGTGFEVGGVNGAGRAFLWRLLANDGCSLAQLPPFIISGTWPFSTVGADTTGPPSPLCANAGSDQIESDVFYQWVADCNGTVTVSTCGTADFDTRIAIYIGCGFTGGQFTPCDLNNILACNDDVPGCSGFTSEVSAPVFAGVCYRIRIGGYQSAQGSGTFTISCAGPCIGDLNGDGVVDGADLGILLNLWGPVGPSALADLNGDGVVDGADLGMLLNNWGAC